MITIEQLLESVDLDFEPRWVTKDESGLVSVWEQKPEQIKNLWYAGCKNGLYSHLKLSEFDGKDWTECIYEVPRKEEFKDKIKIGTLYIDKNVTFGDGDDDDVGVTLEDYEVPRKTTGKIEHIKTRKSIDCSDTPEAHIEKHRIFVEIWDKINELVDAVNELKGEKNETKI